MRTIILAAALLSFGASCTRSTYPPVSQVSESWLELKKSISSTNIISANRPSADFEAQIDDFYATLNAFLSSPVASLYQVRMPENMQFLKALPSALDGLKAAAFNGDDDAVFSMLIEIDMAIEQLWHIESGLSKKSQLDFFLLFFFFSTLVITVVLSLMGMHNRLQKAKSREQQSLAFSRETVLALEHERERIARELHDTVAQDLWRLSFQVDGIGKAQDPKTKSQLCSEVIHEQKEIMQRIREICNSLIPPSFKHRGLDNALRSLCSDFQQRSEIECLVSVEEGLKLGALDTDRQLQIFRVVQECLSNIEKHSGASEAAVFVHAHEKKTLVICVSDNGRGFSAPSRSSYAALHAEGKFGLWSMSERAASMAGSLSLDSTATGTTITLRLPFPEAAL